MNVAELLLGRGNDDSPAILQGTTAVTYRELRIAVGQCATRLLETGAGPGDRVGILAENGPFFVTVYLATIRAGLVVVPFQTESSPESLERIVREAGIRVVWVSRRCERRGRVALEGAGVRLVRESAARESGEGREERGGKSAVSGQRSAVSGEPPSTLYPLPSTLSDLPPPICDLPPSLGSSGAASRSSISDLRAPSSEPPAPTCHLPPATSPLQLPASSSQPRVPTISADLASLLYTSGSTGTPKGVMVTHANLEANTRDIIEYLGLTAADRCMVVLPFCYCYGLSLLHTHLAVGGSLVINNQFLYPEKVLQDLQATACTGLAGVPSTYQILLRKTRFKRMEFPALRWLQQAGGKLPNPYIQEIREAFPAVRFFTMYGQTEATARLSYLPPERLGDKLGSIGQGLRSTRLEVLRPDGGPVTPGSEEIGEIVASGPNIAAGYWYDPQETARYFRNGRLHTGDLARVDADGFIYVVEREREMIKSGGNRVGAKEVEEVIAELPEVVEVAVIGVPHEILGEAIAAFVAPVRGSALTAEAVRAHCERRLPGFKVPETVTFLPQLPHNANGKVVKGELKKGFGRDSRWEMGDGNLGVAGGG